LRTDSHERSDERPAPDVAPPEEDAPGAREALEVHASAVSRGLGRAIIWLRWPLLVGWVLVAVAAYVYLPGTSSLPTAGIYALIPRHTEAFQALNTEERVFGSHLVPQIAIVQRNPSHLGLTQQRRIVHEALLLDRGKLPEFPSGSLAVPVVNTVKLLPGARENSTTAVTYLAFPSRFSTPHQRVLAERYARDVSLPGAAARATGLYVGTLTEAKTINHALTWVEVVSLAVIALVVGVYLQSVLAPFFTVFSAILIYFVSSRVVSWVAIHLSINLHQEAEPIVVVLLVGVITDYSVFFLSGMRDRLIAGEARREAARNATIQFLPIIFTAGLLVTLSLATLKVASIGFIAALGPGMAIVIVITLFVALTFVPSAMGVLGRYMFWPGIKPGQTGRGIVRDKLGNRGLRDRIAALVANRARAGVIATAIVVGLCFLGTGIASARVGLTPIRGLPNSSPPHRALNDASRGFAPGMVAPSDVMLVGKGVADQQIALTRLGRLMQGVPGVAAVIGAGVPALPPRYDVFHAGSGNGARYLVVFRHSPFSANAIDDLRRLENRMPNLLRRAGLPASTRVAYAGDTAIARDTQSKIFSDLETVSWTIFLVDFVLLALFLRAVLAPLYLIVSSALALAATFGVTTYVFQDLLHYESLTYFVPLAAGVLLVAFGSDYNLFIVGRIWQQADVESPEEAIRNTAPRASRAISVAGLALALSFATLAIVPLRSFRELAFAIAFGVLLDTFVVRSLLIPSLIALFGRASWWPLRRA
jgi:RND superfamily putative drug exporter